MVRRPRQRAATKIVSIGNWRLAAAQAVAAAMSGLLFIAIRLRTGSLIPAMAYHALWDFGTLLLVAQVMAAHP